MFKPRFRYTNKIVRLLTRISALREIILNSPLIPKWEVALRQEAIIHSAHSSTSIEGNNRTARVLATLVLYLQGFDTKQFFCLDDYYDSDRRAYYRALQSVDQKTLDLTKWLEYFVEGVNVSMETVKERVIKLSSERLRKTKRGQIALTERQIKIVEHINLNGKITNKDIRDMFKFSDRAALKEIRKLVDLKVIKSEGKGRSLHYVLV